MENRNWLGLLALGIFLSAVVVGYVIYSRRLQTTTPGIDGDQRSVVQISPTPTPVVTPTPLPSVQGINRQTLPRTGVPSFLIGVFAVSAAISGYFLRKFPR